MPPSSNRSARVAGIDIDPTGFSRVSLTGSVEGGGAVLSGGAHHRF